MDESKFLHNIDDMTKLNLGTFQKFATGGNIVKQITDGNCRARFGTGGSDVAERAAFDE